MARISLSACVLAASNSCNFLTRFSSFSISLRLASSSAARFSSAAFRRSNSKFSRCFLRSSCNLIASSRNYTINIWKNEMMSKITEDFRGSGEIVLEILSQHIIR
jgi:hypothetical protein